MATTPSKFNFQTLFLLILLSWTQVSSVIYKSVMWTTNNPLFQNHNKTDNKLKSFCHGGELEMNVNLKSVLPVICPFEDLIMQNMESQPSSGVLYENLWIVYDKKSYDTCDVNQTATFGGGSTKLRNKILYKCDTPDTLKKHVYRIDFKEESPVSGDMYFEANTTYYFLATSDGKANSLDKTSGGHCNNDGDNVIRMKFRVYVCGTTARYNDPKCADPSTIGNFTCVMPESPTSPTPDATTTSIISPSPAVSISHVSSTCENSESFICSCPSVLYKWFTSTVTTEKGTWNGSLSISPSTNPRNSTLSITRTTNDRDLSITIAPTSSNTNEESNISHASNGCHSARIGVENEMLKSRDNWMVVAIVFLVLSIVVLVVMFVVLYRLRKRYSVPCIYSRQIRSVAELPMRQKPSDRNSLILVNSSHSNLAFDDEDGPKKTKSKDTSQSKDSDLAEKQPPTQSSHSSENGVKNGGIESTADKQTKMSSGENQHKPIKHG